MLTLKPEVSDAERAVHHYKNQLLTKAMRAIIRVAMVKPYVHAGDIPEDIVPAADRQGVASNAWNALKGLEIIEQLPQTFNDADREIFAGRTCNKNGHAKKRWVCVYKLASLAKAQCWMERNREPEQAPAPPPTKQPEFAL